MTFEDIKLWIKRLYDQDSLSGLEKRYNKMSNLELANILLSEGLRPEAENITKSILIARLNLNPDFVPSDVFEIEFNRLSELSKMCHICGKNNHSRKEEFLLCKKAGIKINWSNLLSGAALTLVTAPTIGGYVVPLGPASRKYQAVRLYLSLCDSCYRKNKHITKDTCKYHPLAEFYISLGFDEIMWPSEMESY